MVNKEEELQQEVDFWKAIVSCQDELTDRYKALIDRQREIINDLCNMIKESE